MSGCRLVRAGAAPGDENEQTGRGVVNAVPAKSDHSISRMHLMQPTPLRVDPPVGAPYVRPPRVAIVVAAAFGLLGASVTACASGGSAPPARGPVVLAYETEALSATAPGRPLHILFSWSLQEGDARFTGRGATRMAPPNRARVDLFGPRGEGYLSAALVDTEVRLPPGTEDAPLPPPALFWAALGVFRKPEGAELVGSTREGGTTHLEYTRGQERWRFRFENGGLRSAEWVGPGDGRRTIELTAGAEHNLPRQAVYRDWLAFRELRLTLDEVNETEGFPEDIWTIGRR